MKGIAFAVWTGLEPATPCVTGRYSNQLNYQTVFSAIPDYRNSGIRKTYVSQSGYKSKRFFEFYKDFLGFCSTLANCSFSPKKFVFSQWYALTTFFYTILVVLMLFCPWAFGGAASIKGLPSVRFHSACDSPFAHRSCFSTHQPRHLTAR